MTTGRIKVEVKCPHCFKSLMNPETPVDDLPSIDIKAKVGESIGHVYLSALYGSFNKRFKGVEDKLDTIVECSCPHCLTPFPFFANCECKAPIIGVHLQIGGTVKFCTRNGCKHHSVEFENMDSAFQLFQNQG